MEPVNTLGRILSVYSVYLPSEMQSGSDSSQIASVKQTLMAHHSKSIPQYPQIKLKSGVSWEILR